MRSLRVTIMDMLPNDNRARCSATNSDRSITSINSRRPNASNATPRKPNWMARRSNLAPDGWWSGSHCNRTDDRPIARDHSSSVPNWPRSHDEGTASESSESKNARRIRRPA